MVHNPPVTTYIFPVIAVPELSENPVSPRLLYDQLLTLFLYWRAPGKSLSVAPSRTPTLSRWRTIGHASLLSRPHTAPPFPPANRTTRPTERPPTKRIGHFTKSRLRYNGATDTYACPAALPWRQRLTVPTSSRRREWPSWPSRWRRCSPRAARRLGTRWSAPSAGAQPIPPVCRNAAESLAAQAPLRRRRTKPTRSTLEDRRSSRARVVRAQQNRSRTERGPSVRFRATQRGRARRRHRTHPRRLCQEWKCRTFQPSCRVR